MLNVRFKIFTDRFAAMPDRIADGRNLREGYIRACGLQYGDIGETVPKDPLFQRAYKAATGRTVVLGHSLVNLYVMLRYFMDPLPFGHVAEFDSYRGGSVLFMATVLKHMHPKMKIYSFDTFQGMPQTDERKDSVKDGDFADVSLDEIKATARDLRIDNIEFIQGTFEETLPAAIGQIGPLRLVHIDCDTFSGIETSYKYSKQAMVPGAYIVLDDALHSTCIGAFEAAERFLIREDGLHAEQNYPHLVFRHPFAGSAPA